MLGQRVSSACYQQIQILKSSDIMSFDTICTVRTKHYIANVSNLQLPKGSSPQYFYCSAIQTHSDDAEDRRPKSERSQTKAFCGDIRMQVKFRYYK